MRLPTAATAALLALLACADGAHAQERSERFTPYPETGREGPVALATAGPPVAALVGAGILGGAIGGLAGAYVGAWIGSGRCRPGDECFAETISGAALGLAVGESALLSAGVHVANGRRGSYLPSAAATAGLAFGGLGLLHLTHFDTPWAPAILVAVPLAQLTAAVLIERAT